MTYEDNKRYWIMKDKVYHSVFKYSKRYKVQEEMLIDYLKNNRI